MADYPWPGNVRELKHIIERACLLTEGNMLGPSDLFERTTELAHMETPNAKLSAYLAECERNYIRQALFEQEWRIQETANRLGISRKGLWEKMKKLAISRDEETGPTA